MKSINGNLRSTKNCRKREISTIQNLAGDNPNYNLMLLNIIRSVLDSLLRKNQNGIRLPDKF